ncbi:MAG: hypothetical protein NTX85_02300 [Candidatus Nomurabacteria bacterium]|nr:hypothetical protein [Candidatus Nomurabacteria bacterium]
MKIAVLKQVPILSDELKKRIIDHALYMKNTHNINIDIDGVHGINKHTYVALNNWIIDEARVRALGKVLISQEITLIESNLDKEIEEGNTARFSGSYEFFKIKDTETPMKDGTEVFLLTIILKDMESKDYMVITKDGEQIKVLKPCGE